MNTPHIIYKYLFYQYMEINTKVMVLKAVYKLSTTFIRSAQVGVFTLPHKMNMGTILLKLTKLIL